MIIAFWIGIVYSWKEMTRITALIENMGSEKAGCSSSSPGRDQSQYHTPLVDPLTEQQLCHDPIDPSGQSQIQVQPLEISVVMMNQQGNNEQDIVPHKARGKHYQDNLAKMGWFRPVITRARPFS